MMMVVVVVVMVVMIVVVRVMVMVVVVVIRRVGLTDPLAASPLLFGRHDVQGAPLFLVPGAQALTAEHEVIVVDYYRLHPVPASTTTTLRLTGCRSASSSVTTADLDVAAARVGREVIGPVVPHVVVAVVVMVMGLGRCGDHDERRRIPGVSLVEGGRLMCRFVMVVVVVSRVWRSGLCSRGDRVILMIMMVMTLL